MTGGAGAWLTRPVDDRDRTPLFLFPYAGGSASVWWDYVRAEPPSLALCPIALPGRANRVAEPPPSDLAELADELADVLAAVVDRPFGLFGHSFGAVVAAAVARRLRERHHHTPDLLVAASARPVHRFRGRQDLADLPADRLLATMRATGDAPGLAFDAPPEVLEKLVRPLRADLAMASGVEPAPQVPVAATVLAIGGADDQDVTEDDVRSWATCARDRCEFLFLDGAHFAVFDRVDHVLAAVTTLCRSFAVHRRGENRVR